MTTLITRLTNETMLTEEQANTSILIVSTFLKTKFPLLTDTIELVLEKPSQIKETQPVS